MKKLITICQVLVIAAVISALALGADQIIRYNEAMVGQGHPTLADTLNRGFLIQHNAEGVHTTVPYATLTGVPTTNLDNTTMDNTIITRGTIDNTPIGGTTPTAATFTTIATAQVSNTRFNYLSTLSSNVQSQLDLKRALDNVTFTGAGVATYDNEVTATQFNTTGADNVHYINVANTSAPTSPAAGDCYYDNTIKLWNCYTGSAWMSGAIVPIVDNASGPTAAQSYGSWNLVDAAITVLLPTAVKGMSTCVLDSGTAHDIIVDVQATDNVVLVGSVGAGGIGITNASGASTGDFVCLVAAAANKWYVTNKQGTWSSQ